MCAYIEYTMNTQWIFSFSTPAGIIFYISDYYWVTVLGKKKKIERQFKKN